MKKTMLMAMILAASYSVAQTDNQATNSNPTATDQGSAAAQTTNQNSNTPQTTSSEDSASPSQAPASSPDSTPAQSPDSGQTATPSQAPTQQNSDASQVTPSTQNTNSGQTKDAPNTQASENTDSGDATSNAATPQNAAMPEKIDCTMKIPADQKEVNQTVIEKWAAQAAVQTFTMQSDTLDQQLTDLEKCFTKNGWQGYKNALDKSGNLDAIKKEKLDVSSTISGNPTVENDKDNQWSVVIPLTVVYKNKTDSINQNLNVKLLITRDKEGSLGIMQVVAAPQKTQPQQQTTPKQDAAKSATDASNPS